VKPQLEVERLRHSCAKKATGCPGSPGEGLLSDWLMISLRLLESLQRVRKGLVLAGPCTGVPNVFEFFSQ